MVEKLHRIKAAKEAGGYISDSEFYEAIKEGRFPKPDGYIGPRSPFWTETTLRDHQRRLLNEMQADLAADTELNRARAKRAEGRRRVRQADQKAA